MAKKIAIILLAAMLLCACTRQENLQTDETMSAETVTATEYAAPQKGTDGVWNIASASGLELLIQEPDAKFRLTADIDLGGAEWTPIGNAETPFTGELDGCGYSISNFTVAESETLAGFFGVMSGTIKDLNLKNVSLSAESGTMGGIAAVCSGTLEGCSISGTMTAGENAVAGGLVGSADGATLSKCTAELRIEAESTSAVGLLGGALDTVKLENCVYSGNWNRKNGEMFTNLSGTEQNTTFKGCLYRDNSNSDELLTEEAVRLRQLCLENSYAQATIEWTVDRPLTFVCSCGSTAHTQMWEPGETYYGLPYTHKQGSLERFLYCFDEDGNLKQWLPDLGFDGFDMYIGNDCSGHIYWVWAQISDDIRFRWTYTMLPDYDCGVIKVGDYDASGTTTPPMFETNDKNTMLESYARLHTADAIVTYHSGENHARLCTASAVVFRNQNGEIDPEASYLATNGQGDGITENVENSTWVVDRAYTFEELYQKYYIPITVRELQDGKAAEVELSIDNTNEGPAYLCAGTITSNYRITSVTATISRADGSVEWTHTLFTGIGKWETVGSDALLRQTVKSVNMADFASALTGAALKKGESYTYEIRVLLSNSQEYTVKSFGFTY